MTFEEKMLVLMEDRGMTMGQAKEVLDLAKQTEALKVMAGRWQDSVKGYPIEAIVAIWYSVRVFALSWIDDNLPLAFYRSLFEHDAR